MKSTVQKIEIGGKTLELQHGRFAGQANSSIIARYGDTMVLVTAVSAPLKQELDYFPLSVEYIQRLYAGGRIKGSRWVKREGRPSDEDILSARLIDRSIRPLFPKEFKKDVQVIATVLSVDLENDPAILSAVAASAALATSSIPWNGPVATLRVGLKDSECFANPTTAELEFSELDLVMTSSKESVFMIEAGGRQVPEEKVLGALEFGQKESQKIIDGIEKLAEKVGVKKQPFEKTQDKEIITQIGKKFVQELDKYIKENATKEGNGQDSEIKKAILEAFPEEKPALVSAAFDKAVRERVRETILSGKRLDGRKHDEIREVSGEVGVLPRTHGSAVFTRGQTQALTVTTLGSPRLGQLIESGDGEEEKRYIHHYSMPPYSIGETGRVGSPSRREIGHGALAERALLAVIPPKDKFPYTVQVVSEVLSSNGSTSMASTCGSTMSLMDAGVPILAPVSGIAMGLVIEGKDIAILSDIMGIEDGSGDMDFKVAGTKEGVTAIQLDVKTPFLTLEVLGKALKQAREGRLFILGKMLEVISETRAKISAYAPKIAVTHVPVEKIGEIIGPGGKMIKKIMADTGTTIDVEDDGSVAISGINQEAVDSARAWVEGLVKEAQPGEIYDGEVKRIQPFGAFVEILPGKDGLVHVSDMAEEFVKDPQDIVRVGDKVKVKVKEIDDLGRINLTMRLNDDISSRPAKRTERVGGARDGFRERRGGRDRGERRGREGGSHRFGKAGSPRSRFGEAGSPRSRFGEAGSPRGEAGRGGPHFPASRFIPSKKRF